MCATYYARTSDHGYETCAEHLAMAGCLAEGLPRASGILTTDCWLVWSTIWANIRMLSSGESATPIIADPLTIRRPVRCC